MRRRFWFASLIVLCVLLLGAVLYRFWSSSPGDVAESQKRDSSTATTSTNPSSFTPADQTRLTDAFRAQFDKLQKAGLVKILPSPQKFLEDAVASRDKAEILRAFHEVVYKNYWKKDKTIATLEGFLNNPDPYVRFSAANGLFVMGEKSGYATLLALVQEPDPIAGIGLDVRVNAAQTLSRFGQTDAIDAIAALFTKTQAVELSSVLADLRVPLPVEDELPFVPSSLALSEYAKAGVKRFLPQITELFQKTSQTDLKNAAAWALATMTGDQAAIDYLLQSAQTALAEQKHDRNSRSVVKELGSVQDPRVKSVLEAALASKDNTVVETAIVNLLYNQGGSDKAVQVIVNQLNNPTHGGLPWDFVLNVAAQLTDKPEIRSAGAKFAENDASGDWLLYTVERKKWPIANWIGNYVILVKSGPVAGASTP